MPRCRTSRWGKVTIRPATVAVPASRPPISSTSIVPAGALVDTCTLAVKPLEQSRSGRRRCRAPRRPSGGRSACRRTTTARRAGLSSGASATSPSSTSVDASLTTSRSPGASRLASGSAVGRPDNPSSPPRKRGQQESSSDHLRHRPTSWQRSAPTHHSPSPFAPPSSVGEAWRFAPPPRPGAGATRAPAPSNGAGACRSTGAAARLWASSSGVRTSGGPNLPDGTRWRNGPTAGRGPARSPRGGAPRAPPAAAS